MTGLWIPKEKRGSFDGYWGWGDDWGYVHGEYLAEMNSYNPVAEQVKALDEYLDVAIWQNLMQEHQEDFLIHDFLMPEPIQRPLTGDLLIHIFIIPIFPCIRLQSSIRI